MDREHASPIAERFTRFATTVEADSPLYARLCRYVATDPALLALVSGAPASQPVPNLLLAATHDLLLSGVDDPLATAYPSVGGSGDLEGVERRFRDFCLRHGDHISAVVASRNVQTNEVRRCVAWIPALAVAVPEGPIALVEIGASAGLNLRLDAYGYRFGDQGIGDPSAPLILDTELRGPVAPPIPPTLPDIAWRSGIDLAPIDLEDEEAVRWATALLWPEQVDRIERFRSAVDIARRHPVRIVEGDALDALPRVVADAPGDASLVIVHSFVVNQFSTEGRAALDRVIADLGRPATRLSLEWLEPDTMPMLDLIGYHDGTVGRRTRLAEMHYHGAWIRWLAE